jgi:hypothetical protein
VGKGDLEQPRKAWKNSSISIATGIGPVKICSVTSVMIVVQSTIDYLQCILLPRVSMTLLGGWFGNWIILDTYTRNGK